MKVLFVSRLFDGVSGGVERMATTIMNDLIGRGRQVELLTWDRDGATAFFPLDPEVVWHKLALGDPTRKASLPLVWRRLRRMRNIVRERKPDVIIGFQQGAFYAVAVAALGLGIPLVAAERNAPQRFDHLKGRNRRAFEFLTLRLADVVTVQLESYRRHYPPAVARRIEVIPNPVHQVAAQASPIGRRGQRKQLLCVARLSYQKNQRILLDAFARLAGRFPDWDLALVGAGEDEARLQAHVRTLGLIERVRFTGAVGDVSGHYLASHLFCLPSRWEGFPNALAEAMAFGLPSVGFAGCAGVNELIVDGQTGLLAAAGAEGLADALARLMEDDALRAAAGAAGRRAIAAFAPEAVLPRWDELFVRLAGRQ